jgi:hypothetical protein
MENVNSENVMPNIYVGIRLVINSDVGLIVRLIAYDNNDSGATYLLHKCDLKTNLETYIISFPKNFLELTANEKIFKQISKNMFDIDNSLVDRLYNKFREVLTTEAYYGQGPLYIASDINEIDTNSDYDKYNITEQDLIEAKKNTDRKILCFDGGNSGTAIPGLNPNKLIEGDKYKSESETAIPVELNIPELNLKEAQKMHDEKFGRRLTINLPELPREHFISQYLKYATGITDAYIEYQFCVALWLLSAVTQDKFILKLDRETIKPNLWFFILGKSTTSHKSTVINMAKDVFEKVSETKIFNVDYTLEGYLQILANNPIENFVRDEAAGLMAKYHKKNNEGILDAECAIYDGQSYRKNLYSKKKDNKSEVYDVKNPFVTKFYATTPESLSRDMKIDDFQKGFGVRFLISSPQYKKPYRKDTALKSKENVDAEIMISQRLKKLQEAIKKMSAVDFAVTVDAMKYYNDLVRETENKFDDMNNSMLSTAFGRSQEHIFKIAMLLEIGKPLKQDSNEINHIIDLDTMKISCELVINYFLPTMMDTINNLQNATNRTTIDRIIQTLRRLGGSADHSRLLHDTKMQAKEFKQCIETMIESKAIIQFIDDKTKTNHYQLLASNEMPNINI